VAWATSGDSLVTMKTPTRAVVLIEARGAVGLARAARNRCGSERGRAQGFEDSFNE
jgi:hypothetical protein